VRMESHDEILLTEENLRTRRRICTSPTLFTTNPTWTDTAANPGFCGERPGTNCLSRGTADLLKVIQTTLYSLHKYLRLRSQSSSVSVVSGYGLDGREIEVRSPAGKMDFFL
jgi:hypothetical protein